MPPAPNPLIDPEEASSLLGALREALQERVLGQPQLIENTIAALVADMMSNPVFREKAAEAIAAGMAGS